MLATGTLFITIERRRPQAIDVGFQSRRLALRRSMTAKQAKAEAPTPADVKQQATVTQFATWRDLRKSDVRPTPSAIYRVA